MVNNDKHLRSTPYPTRVDLPAETRAQIVKGLNVALASAIDLRTQVKQAHWNLKGPQFIALHEMFDDFADHLSEWSDTMAERATTLGGYAEGTARLAAAQSTLPEYDLDAVDGRQHIMALADRFGAFTSQLRKLQKATADLDAMTEDIYVEVLRGAEQDLWFIEAHAQS